ncbi:hypothetical protein V2A60_003264 [Cordyceps javanica]
MSSQEEQTRGGPNRRLRRSTRRIENISDGGNRVKDTIQPKQTLEIIEKLGHELAHVPFNIIGRAALVYHGHHRRVSHIAMACMKGSLQAVRSWAQSKGMPILDGDDVSGWFGYRMTDGSLCRVRVYSLECTPCNQARTQTGNRSKVMTLPNMISEYARLYTNGVRSRRHEREQSLIAYDILWMLAKFSQTSGGGDDDEGDGQAFTSDDLQSIGHQDFLGPFVSMYPEFFHWYDAIVFRCVDSEAAIDLERLRHNLLKLQEYCPPFQDSREREVSIHECGWTAMSRVASLDLVILSDEADDGGQ